MAEKKTAKAAKKTVQFLGTGRRKKSVARVRLIPNGTGKITINKVDVDEYFGQDTLKLILKQPLELTNTKDKYDIVVANILHNVLDPLTPVIVNQLKKGGIYITSGIIDEKEEFVLDVMKREGLEVLEVTRQGEWVSITARK